jgi:hypothetical protein
MPHAYTPAETTRIAARLDKLARSLSEPEHRPLLAVFALAAEQVQAAPATGLRYVDKTTGSEVRLTPNPAQPLVRTHQQDTENAGDLGRDHRLMPVTQRSRGDEYQIFTSPDSESGEDTLATLRNDPRVAMAAPSFHTAGSAPVFLDPAFCVVQFKDR